MQMEASLVCRTSGDDLGHLERKIPQPLIWRRKTTQMDCLLFFWVEMASTLLPRGLYTHHMDSHKGGMTIIQYKELIDSLGIHSRLRMVMEPVPWAPKTYMFRGFMVNNLVF